jgi:hypothetical protein
MEWGVDKPKQTMLEVETEAQRLTKPELERLVVMLHAGNIAKQKYLDGLEFYIAKLKQV